MIRCWKISVFVLCVLSRLGAESEHPSLFFDRSDLVQIRANAASSEWLGEVAERIVSRADEFLDYETEPYLLWGKTNGIGTTGRAFQKRVGLLAFAGFLTGEERYFFKGREILLAVARQTEPRAGEHWQAHLQYSDAAQGFCIGYDWLYDWLSEGERAEVLAEITGFGHLLENDNTIWGKPDPAVSSCNHNSVHFGALGLCGLLTGNDRWVKKGEDRVRAYLRHSMDETGYITEGHSYMGYGMQGALPFAVAWKRKGGPDLVAEQPAMSLIFEQVLWKRLPGQNLLLAMNDNRNDLGHEGILMYPIMRYKDPLALWTWLEIEGENGAQTYGIGRNGYLGSGLTAPFILIWADPELEPMNPVEMEAPLSRHFASGRVFMRDAWMNPLAAHVSITSGVDFHRGHNHQDENAITLHALGEDFLIDPGYMPNSSYCHNTLLINGVGQVMGSSGRIVDYRDEGLSVYVRGQAPEAYDWSQALVGQFDRQVLFVREPEPYLIVVDHAQLEHEVDTEFKWLLRTHRRNALKRVGEDLVIRGHRNGNHCLVKNLSGTSLEWVVGDEIGKTFERRDKTYEYARFFKGAHARAVRHNADFCFGLFPYSDKKALPEVKMVRSKGRVEISLLFAANRVIDRVIVTENGIDFVRSAN